MQKSEIHSEYYCESITIRDTKLAIVIGKDNKGSKSITNDIENVARANNVDTVVYKDSLETWSYWDAKNGFLSLTINGTTPTNAAQAIDFAIEKEIL